MCSGDGARHGAAPASDSKSVKKRVAAALEEGLPKGYVLVCGHLK